MKEDYIYRINIYVKVGSEREALTRKALNHYGLSGKDTTLLFDKFLKGLDNQIEFDRMVDVLIAKKQQEIADLRLKKINIGDLINESV